MTDSERERHCLVALSLVPGLGAVRVARLLAHFGSAEAASTADPVALAGVPGIGRGLAAAVAAARGDGRASRAFECAARAGARVITRSDPAYPVRLRQIAAAPPVLYVRGGWPDDAPAAAIVGTRRATPYGLTVAERLASALAESQVAVVSGLARGIDAAAHAAVVRARGCTVGVLACGVDVAYPPEHRTLMAAMLARGALLAEAPMGAPPERGAFPARNRLISGLADAVVVVEGDLDSGALITARQAETQGRPVFAVPGSVYARGSAGPHHLLAMGARVLTHPDDLLAVLERASPGDSPGAGHPGVPPGLTRAEQAVVAALDRGEARAVDGVAAAAGVRVADAAAALVALEVRGLVHRMPGGLYVAPARSWKRQI